MSPLDHFNSASPADAKQLLLTCCGSHAWAQSLLTQRPFLTARSLESAGEASWFALPEPAWLEAFAAHPRIGEKVPSPVSQRESPGAPFMAQPHRDMSGFHIFSTSEQAAAQQSLAPVAENLALLNHLYEEKFGFRYIVFASGRSAPELLQLLEARITRTRDEELHEAARQQQRITHLRMAKWLYP